MVKPKSARVCECCGHPLPAFNTLRGLTPTQQKMFHAIDESGQRGISRRGLLDAVYGDDPNGGPLYVNTLNVMRAKMKDVLAEHGLRIITTTDRYWRLEKIG